MIFVICLTIGMKPKRNYRSLPLSLLALWSFMCVFVHSTEIINVPIANTYINASLMFEGFIYILFGSLFIQAVVNYSSNVQRLWWLLPIAMIPWIKEMMIGRITVVAAFMIAWGIYMILKKRWVVPVALFLSAALFAYINWEWVVMKMDCRPEVWSYLCKDIARHPVIGEGFSKYLWGNMKWCSYKGYGWLYRHNDYLGIGAYLGIPAMLFVLWFVVDTIKRIKVRLLLIPFLTIVIACFFQMIMFFPGKGAICLVIAAIVITGTYKEEENEVNKNDGVTSGLFLNIGSMLRARRYAC